MRAIFLFLAVFILLNFANFVNSQEVEGFNVNPNVIKAAIRENGSVNYPISIFNADSKQEFQIKYLSKFDFIEIKQNSLDIDKEGIGILNVYLDSHDWLGVFVGNIIISSKKESVKIPVILEVESIDTLFDVRAKIPPKFFEISHGEEIAVDITIWNIASKEGNVDVEYYISDLEGNIINYDNESYNVESSLSVRKNFKIPEDAQSGDYVFYTYVKKDGIVGTNSLIFYVGDLKGLSPEFNFEFSDYFYFIGGVAIVIVIATFLFNHFTNRKLVQAVQWRKRISDIRRTNFGNINSMINRLIRQKQLLEEAYNKGYIKKISYEEGRDKLDRLISMQKRKLL